MKILDFFNKILEKICFVLMIIMLSVTFAQVINRYIFGGSFFWAEECAILCMIWVTFLGSTIAIRRNSHTRIDFLINIFPPKLKKAVEVIDYLLMTVFVLYLGYISFDVLKINKGVLTVGLKISRSVMYSSLTVGMIFMAVYFIFMAICRLMDYDVDGGVK